MPSGRTETREADHRVRLPRVVQALERATIAAEAPLCRFVKSGRLNPLPHAGSISVFLLFVVTLTGIYLTFFFEFGFEASYRAVTKLEGHPIQRAGRHHRSGWLRAGAPPRVLRSRSRHVHSAPGRWPDPNRRRRRDRCGLHRGAQSACVDIADGLGGHHGAGGGLPPGDCAYGLGNMRTSDRLEGRRPPLLPMAWTARVTHDWVSPGTLASARAHPGVHGHADVDSAPPGWKVLVPVGLVVFGSVFGIRFATDAPYRRVTDEAVVRVVLDHQPGGRIEGQPAASTGAPIRVEVRGDGQMVVSRQLAEEPVPVSTVLDIAVSPDTSDLEVVLWEGDTATVLLSGPVDVEAGRRLVVSVVDEPPDPIEEEGRRLFTGAGMSGNLGYEIRHSLEPGRDGVGPSLAGVAGRAADRMPGLTAAEYLRRSIVDPDAFLVPGYRAGQMLAVYEERLAPEQIDALVAFLLTLDEP